MGEIVRGVARLRALLLKWSTVQTQKVVSPVPFDRKKGSGAALSPPGRYDQSAALIIPAGAGLLDAFE